MPKQDPQTLEASPVPEMVKFAQTLQDHIVVQEDTVGKRLPSLPKALQERLKEELKAGMDAVADAESVRQEQVTKLVGRAPDYDKKMYLDALSENSKRDFTHQLMELRQPPPAKPYTPPAVPERVRLQTNAEMEAGRLAVAAAEAVWANRPRPQRNNDGTMTEVFRPENYVPN